MKQPTNPWNKKEQDNLYKQNRQATQDLSRARSRFCNEEKHPPLRLTPYAYAKLHFLCHLGQTEIGGFAISRSDDLLLIEDLVLVKQTVSMVSVEFDDDAVADFFDLQVDQGRRPEEFGRIWVHTHPGSSATPSGTDEQTFDRVFGGCDWAVMFILAREGETYARLRFNTGPGGQMLIPVQVDYDAPFEASDHELWQAEYQREVVPVKFEPFDLLIDDKRPTQNGRRRRRNEDFVDVFADALEKPQGRYDDPASWETDFMGLDPWEDFG